MPDRKVILPYQLKKPLSFMARHQVLDRLIPRVLPEYMNNKCSEEDGDDDAKENDFIHVKTKGGDDHFYANNRN
jgi:hypothetical protein